MTVAGPQPRMSDAPVPAPVESAPAFAALSIGLVGAEGLARGQQALLTVLVVNPGAVDALPALVVQDVLPDGMTFSHAVTEDWGCASDDGMVVTCTWTSALTGGSMTALQLTADVADDTTGTVTNVASVSSASLDPTVPPPTTVDTLLIGDSP